jgi:hypothetical protein
MNPDENKKDLDAAMLVDLFKHFDSRVGHQENLFVPLTFGGIPLICLGWEKITPEVVATVGAVSVGIYLYHLLIIRRFATYQENIFHLLEKTHGLNIRSLTGKSLATGQGFVGIQKLRGTVWLILTIAWLALTLASLRNVPASTALFYFWGCGGVLLASIIIWFSMRPKKANP